MQRGISTILTDSLKAALEVLNGNRIPYALMGGMALQVWGRPRSTRDIDISVGLDDLTPEEFISLVGRSGFSFRDSRTLGESMLIRFERRDGPTGIDVEIDFFTAGTEYQRRAIERAIAIELRGMPIKVVAPEDLIIQKLAAGRVIDEYDARELAKDQSGTLDWAYLNDCGALLGIEDKISALCPA
ncbi:MAG: nucleotidyl transferase AbiEii/AbiGii toxin family protein [Candidatus Eremiobacteraeota bacterium]|nr:nucleotidyl transferase AbiEii/AbiGii toxin family protein [Candidatus Eremiobacteraeota bacterium]